MRTEMTLLTGGKTYPIARAYKHIDTLDALKILHQCSLKGDMLTRLTYPGALHLAGYPIPLWESRGNRRGTPYWGTLTRFGNQLAIGHYPLINKDGMLSDIADKTYYTTSGWEIHCNNVVLFRWGLHIFEGEVPLEREMI